MKSCLHCLDMKWTNHGSRSSLFSTTYQSIYEILSIPIYYIYTHAPVHVVLSRPMRYGAHSEQKSGQKDPKSDLHIYGSSEDHNIYIFLSVLECNTGMGKPVVFPKWVRQVVQCWILTHHHTPHTHTTVLQVLTVISILCYDSGWIFADVSQFYSI